MPTLERLEIADYLPHAGRMVLLDRTIYCDASKICCVGCKPTDPQHPLREDCILPITVGFEYAAQAATLHTAIDRRAQRSKEGHLAVLQDVTFGVQRLDEIQAELHIEAVRLALLPVGLHYRFALEADAQTLMEGRLIIALGDKQDM